MQCTEHLSSPLGDRPTQQPSLHWAHRKYSILHHHQDIRPSPASYSPCAGSCFYAGQPWDVSMFRGFMRKTSFISHFAQCQCLQSQVGSKSMRWVRCLWDHLFQTELNLNLWYENGQKFRPNIDTPCRHRLCGSPHRRTRTRRTLFLFSDTSPDIFPIHLQIFFETSSDIFRRVFSYILATKTGGSEDIWPWLRRPDYRLN